MLKTTKKAFTLAEVLITLAVIGVIASMTIPSLINSTNDKETVVQLKKAFSIASNAHQLLTSQGRTSELGVDDASDFNLFASVLNIQKNCGMATGQGCFPLGVMYKRKNGDNWATFDDNASLAKGVLTNGMMFFIYNFANNCAVDYGDGPLDGKVCGEFVLDINGNKGPNQSGRDTFQFWYTQDGIYPYGSVYDTTYTIADDCEAVAALGYACTAKVLLEDAINY